MGQEHSYQEAFDTTALQPPLETTPRVPHNITKSRINNFMASGGQFHTMGIHQGLWELRHSGEPHVSLHFYSVPKLGRITFKDAMMQPFVHFQNDQRKFGPSWSTHWFLVSISIPDAFIGREVIFQWDMECEGMVWSEEGIPLQGLTGGSDQSRHDYILTKKASHGQTFKFYIEAACNGMFGVGNNDAMVPDPNRYFQIKKADLVSPSHHIQDLFHDLSIIRGIAYDTEEGSVRSRSALWTLNEIINNFLINDSSDFLYCKRLAKDFLSHKNGQGQHKVTALGNCHIDTAWLWPYNETKRKVARSWSSQLNLMDRYPDYIFTASQAQQYDWLKDLYPETFMQIKEKEKEGKWEIIGGSWVEHDTNMPSGESLCRQMLLGQRFFEKHFGKRTKIFWLPDSFGYSAQLPQVLCQSGCDYFFTQKLSWNNINTFPLTTFWWTGIDNSSVLAHLTPAETYNASVTPSELHKCAKNNHDIETVNHSLLVYGHGDGGGGPTPEMLERLKRVEDVNGLPTCRPGTALGFFKSLETESKRIQSYKGELYLEFHRGTYTTQALVKKGNRKGEVLLRDLEIISVIALTTKPMESNLYTFKYPVDSIDRLWKLLCINQFHDCLPGSAIGLAFKDVHKYHRDIMSQSLLLRHKAQDYIISNTCEPRNNTEKQTDDKNGILIFNTLPWTRSEVISMNQANKMDASLLYDHGQTYALVEDITGLGVTGYVDNSTIAGDSICKDPVRAYVHEDNTFVLENVYLKAVFNQDGQLIELIDKRVSRGSLVPKRAKGNVLVLYEDVPTYWDAWDVEIYHLQKYKQIEGSKNLEIISAGPYKAELKLRQEISKKSYISQIISLTCIGERIEFSNTVEWYESHQFLKVEFPWDLVSDYATYDIQYGVIRRPTHYNSTQDSARFEVCGHKFADLSESNYGVALINNCKYGYATQGNVQRLSLLRSPKGPDENADMGQHTFKYAIYPHDKNFCGSNVVREALEFNVPLSIRQSNGFEIKNETVSASIFEINPSERVILDTIKLAEDDQGKGETIILRLYEAYGGKTATTLKSCLSIEKIQISNILEDDGETITANDSSEFPILMNPFQILTLKVTLKKDL
ncbi:glycosyl hydrolases family 38 N-terminal domain-containing protein [Spinellus fusiger]|nr:glycosyl hydrolases family 38 N-terminal domain-containing protein [Spinellus fusiger]